MYRDAGLIPRKRSTGRLELGVWSLESGRKR
jgi:hypothetical protein